MFLPSSSPPPLAALEDPRTLGKPHQTQRTTKLNAHRINARREHVVFQLTLDDSIDGASFLRPAICLSRSSHGVTRRFSRMRQGTRLLSAALPVLQSPFDESPFDDCIPNRAGLVSPSPDRIFSTYSYVVLCYGRGARLDDTQHDLSPSPLAATLSGCATSLPQSPLPSTRPLFLSLLSLLLRISKPWRHLRRASPL